MAKRINILSLQNKNKTRNDVEQIENNEDGIKVKAK